MKRDEVVRSEYAVVEIEPELGQFAAVKLAVVDRGLNFRTETRGEARFPPLRRHSVCQQNECETLAILQIFIGHR